MQASFYWHDYETSGADPRRDRPMQFAGLRTTPELEPIGVPLTLYCRIADDQLVWPQATLITGITPQQANAAGLPEPDFAAHIQAELAQPGTCGAGYNSLRFDDEVTRHLFWRTFHEPYAREYRNGNSRFDLIDVLRMTHALRPEGLQWPCRSDGSPSFRLQDLAAAQDISEHQAHDALGDVQATVALARLLRSAQPRLWDWALSLRSKQRALALLDWRQMTPVLHVSARYPAQRACLAVVAPVCEHPWQPGAVIVVDLSRPLAPLLELDSDELAERVFAPREAIPEDLEVPGIKLVRANRVPMLAPLSVLRPDDRQRLGLDLDALVDRVGLLRAAQVRIRDTLSRLYASTHVGVSDAECALYDGFLPNQDAARLPELRIAEPQALAELGETLHDLRLRELLFRHRARWFPNTLNAAEQTRWHEFRRRKLIDDDALGGLLWDELQRQVAQLRQQHHDDSLSLQRLDAVLAWGRHCVATLPTPLHSDA